MMDDSTYLLGTRRFRSAVDRAYYAMYHAARAALYDTGVSRLRSHQGLSNQFSLHFVRPRLVEAEYSRSLGQALDQRLLATYDYGHGIGADQAEEVVKDAQGFVTRIRQLLPGASA